MDILAYVLAKKYTDKALAGGGSTIKGKNCTIQSITDITGGHRVTFAWELDDGTAETDYMDVMDGADGQDGQTGPSGADGQDGFSPVVSITSITGGHRLSITDATSTKTVDIMDGADGQNGQNGAPGADGYSPTISVTSVTGGHQVTVTDASGSTSFTVTDGLNGTNGIDGRGISSVAINNQNHLIVTYTDGSSADAGLLPVGQDGNNISY